MSNKLPVSCRHITPNRKKANRKKEGYESGTISLITFSCRMRTPWRVSIFRKGLSYLRSVQAISQVCPNGATTIFIFWFSMVESVLIQHPKREKREQATALRMLKEKIQFQSWSSAKTAADSCRDPRLFRTLSLHPPDMMRNT